MKKAEVGKAKPRRPGSVVVAGWCAILAVPLILGRFLLLAVNGQVEAAIASASGNPALWISPQGLQNLALALILPIAVISLVTGIAILSLKRWSWVVLMLFLALALVLNLARAYFRVPEYGLMLIYTLLALLLNQPDVRRAFRIGSPDHEPIE